jgi:uncharacterized protein involved in exopolysaccharide biosynthesis
MTSRIMKSSLEPPPQPEYDSAEPRPIKLEIARSLRMNRKLAISVALATFVVLIAFGLTRKSNYKTSSLVYVQPTSRLITDATGGAFDSARYDSYLQQQFLTVLRPDILSEALDKAGPGTWRFEGESQRRAIERLQNTLTVERVQGSYQMAISLTGTDPAAITKIVNAVTDTYLSKSRRDELAQSDQQLHVLSDERQRIQADLDKIRQEQTGLSSTLGVADTAGEAANPYDTQLTDLRTQLAAARAAHSAAIVQLSTISGGGPQGAAALNAAADEIAATDAGLNGLKTATSQRRGVLTSQMAGLTPSNPLYKQDEQELDRLNQALEKMTVDLRRKAAQQLQSKLSLEVARTAALESRLASRLTKETSVATSAAPELQRASDLAASITRLQARFAVVDNAIRAIELEQNSSGQIHLSLAAVQPLSPKASKREMILTLALPFALAFGTLVAIIKHKRDPRVYIGDDVENVLLFQPMAVLPRSEDVDQRVMDEFMLRLVAGVDQAHRSGHASTYIFTATTATTDIKDLVASLAVKTNYLGYRTMILRASDALQSLVPSEEPVGSSWGGTQLAKSGENRLTHVKRESLVFENLERLKRNVDILFIEALPILSSAETEFVARLADATILIAESGKTTRQELKNSLALVRRLNVAGVGAVLNDVSLDIADSDFVTAVRNVQERRADVGNRGGSRQRVEKDAPVNDYEDMDLVSRDQ